MQAIERISIRTTPHAKAVIAQASEMMGVSMSHFILTTMYQQSLELLQKSQQWQLSDNDSQLVKELLDNPPPPTPAMKELLALTDNIKDLT